MAALVHKAAMDNGGHDEGETFYDTTAEEHGHNEASAWGNSDDTGEWVPKTRKPSGRPELKPTRRSSRVPGEWVDDTQVDEDSQEDEDERNEPDEADEFADVEAGDGDADEKQDLGLDQELHQHERADGVRAGVEAAKPARGKSSTPFAPSATERAATRKSKSPPGPSRGSGSGSSDASLLNMRATPQRLDGEAFLSDDSLEEPGSTIMHGVSPVRRALEGKSATPSGAGTNGGGVGGGIRRTDSGGVREQQSLIDKLQRENFELKLRITLLTESFQETSGMSEAELRKRLADELQRYEMLQIDYRLLRENFDKQVAGHERDLEEAQAQLQMLEEDNARLVAELRDLEYERDELARVEEDYYALKSQIDASRDMRAGSSTAAADFPDSPASNSMRSLVQRLNSNNEQLKRRIYEDERDSATSSPPFQRGGDKWGQTIRLLQSLLAQLDYDSDLSPGRRSPASPDGVVLDLVARLEVAVDRFKQRYANLEAQYQNERLQLQRELLATSTDLRDTIKDKNALQALVHDQEDELDRLHEELRLRRTDSPVDGLKAGVELRKAQRELDKYRTVVDELLGFVHEHYDSHADVATLTDYIRDIFKLVGTIEEIRKNFDEMEAQTRQREDALASLTAERDTLAADIDKFKARQRADAKSLQDAMAASRQLESDKADLERRQSKLETEKAEIAKEKAALEIRAESLQKQVEENGYALAEDLAKTTEKLRISERENKELKRRVVAFEQSATGSTERALGDTKTAKRLGDAQRETETLLRDKKLLEDRIKSLEDKLAFETTKSDGLSAKLRSGGSGHSRQSSGTGIRSNLEMQKAFQAESYKRLITLQEQVDRLEKDRRDDHETIKFLQAKANKNHNDSYRIVTSFFLKGEKLLSPEEAQKISARLAEIKKHDNGKLPLMEALMMETLDNLVRKHERDRREQPQEAPTQDSSSSKSNSKLWAARYQELERRLAKEEALRRAERESYEQRLQQMTQEVLMQRTENQKLK